MADGDVRPEIQQGVVEAPKRGMSRQQAIRTTKLKHYDAAVAEWLHDYTPNKQLIRGRFEHGVSNASDETLARAKSVIGAVVAAIESNDVSALSIVDDIFKEHFGFERANDLIEKARGLIDSAASELRASRSLRAQGILERISEERAEDGSIIARSVEDVPSDAFVAEFLITMLGSLDERFRTLDAAQTVSALSSIAPDGESGRGKKKATAVLLDLAVECDAFDLKKAPDPGETVRNALKYAGKKRNKRG